MHQDQGLDLQGQARVSQIVLKDSSRPRTKAKDNVTADQTTEPIFMRSGSNNTVLPKEVPFQGLIKFRRCGMARRR
jgi:hypothetical protein